jgi:hypothetical protein
MNLSLNQIVFNYINAAEEFIREQGVDVTFFCEAVIHEQRLAFKLRFKQGEEDSLPNNNGTPMSAEETWEYVVGL